MKNKIDYEAFSDLMLDISPRIKTLNKLFPKNKEYLLEHLAAASIHFALFAKAVFLDKEGEENINEDYIKLFLEKCGCKDLNK